ncbi:MAG TPA: phosphopantetheine-binding protein [Thermoanaerobaculia bacterium]|nr:phosphopantetheine-binding protein [Thermoanaerobaculia bacterium]
MHEEQWLAVIDKHVATVAPELAGGLSTLDCSLADLGLNSIDRAEVTTLLMEEFGVAPPIHELGGVSDLRSLVTLLGRYL